MSRPPKKTQTSSAVPRPLADRVRKATTVFTRALLLGNAAQVAAQPEAVPDPAAPLTVVRTASDPVLGPDAATFQLFEFGDYRRAGAREAFTRLSGLLADQLRLQLVYRPVPVLGEASHIAARASVAAWRQNDESDRWGKFHAALLDAADAADIQQAIADAASQSGLDLARLQEDMARPETVAAIDENCARHGANMRTDAVFLLRGPQGVLAREVDLDFVERLLRFDEKAVDAMLGVQQLVRESDEGVAAERVRAWTFEIVKHTVLAAPAPTVAGAYNNRGVHLLALSGYAKAVEDEGVRAAPRLTDVHMAGALSLVGEGQHPRGAIEDFSEALALWRLFGWRGSSGRWRGLVPAPRSGPTAGEDGAAGRPKGVFRGPRTGMIVIRGRAGAVVPRPAADGAERAARRRRGGASRCRRTPAPPASASGRGVRPWRRPAPATSSRTPPAPPASSSSPCRG